MARVRGVVALGAATAPGAQGEVEETMNRSAEYDRDAMRLYQFELVKSAGLVRPAAKLLIDEVWNVCCILWWMLGLWGRMSGGRRRR